MERIKVGRYKNPESVGYVCWIETSRWIIWVGLDGNLTIGTDREDDGGVNELTAVEV